jgi:sulfite reductase alpha subunit-like flavoprotein
MKGVMYICGSVKMGKDIFNVIEEMFKKIKKV